MNAQDGGENKKMGVKNGGEKLSPKYKPLVSLMIDNPTISIIEMAQRLKIGTSTIERHLRILRQEGFIEHIGPAKGGRWKVNVQL